MLTRPDTPLSLLVFLGAIVAVFALLGHVWMGAAVALFVLALVALDAKPSWKRISGTRSSAAEAARTRVCGFSATGGAKPEAGLEPTT